MESAHAEMRWDNLFDDLESQLERELDAEEIDLRAEEERLRLARLALRDRLIAVAACDEPAIAVRMTDGAALRVRPITFGKDWFAADVVTPNSPRSSAEQVVVPLAAIASLTITEAALDASTLESPSTGSRLVDRLGLAFVLRDFCRRRTPVELVSAAGEVHGTIDRVGRDHLDLAVHEAGSPRRAANVMELRIVPLTSIVLLRVR